MPCQNVPHAQPLPGQSAAIQNRQYRGQHLSRRCRESAHQPALPDADLALESRSPYRRHQLLGINFFALEMFDQFRTDLGLFKFDPNLPSPLAKKISSQRTAVAGSADAGADRHCGGYRSFCHGDQAANYKPTCEVQNLAGHNFPSGVSFRRAFLNFQVLRRRRQCAMGIGQYQLRGGYCR